MFNAVVYVSGYLFLLFVAVCLGARWRFAQMDAFISESPSPTPRISDCILVPSAACGLYYLAELVEEYTSLTKRLMYMCTCAVLVAHPLFFFFEQLPLSALLCGAAAHACYLWLLQSFPFIRLRSPPFLASLTALIVSHYFWISHFLSHYHNLTHVRALRPRHRHAITSLPPRPATLLPPRHHLSMLLWVGEQLHACCCWKAVSATCSRQLHMGGQVLCFLLFAVWLVPFGFFISFSVNESTLPDRSADLRLSPSPLERPSSPL